MSTQSPRAFARQHVLVLLLASAALTCRSPAEPGSRRVVGIIDNGGTGIAPLVVPDTVSVGVPFLATVTTFGGACDHPEDPTRRRPDCSRTSHPMISCRLPKRSASQFCVHHPDPSN